LYYESDEMIIGIDASNIGSDGTIRHLVEILRWVDPGEHGITRIIVWGSEQLLKLFEPRPWLQREHEPGLDSTLLPQRLLWRASRLSSLAEQRCDVLFVPSGTYIGSFKPFVTISQNLIPFVPAERRRYLFSLRYPKFTGLERYQQITFRQASGVIFLTEGARTQVEQRTGNLTARTAIVPHGVDETFRCMPRRADPLKTYSWQRPFRWLYTSTIDLYKHQWHVVEAIARLRQAGLPVALDLCGGTVFRPALNRLQDAFEKYSTSGTELRYHGPIPHQQLPRFYQEADGFVFASSCEAFGQSLLEAMAAGLPIGCANRSVMPSILGNAGVYFNPEKPANMASVLATFMENQAWREQCAWAAYQRAQAYSWQRCARETFAFVVQCAR
jgi:glycosyltransferase involved in cell wall biosynthesis